MQIVRFHHCLGLVFRHWSLHIIHWQEPWSLGKKQKTSLQIRPRHRLGLLSDSRLRRFKRLHSRRHSRPSRRIPLRPATVSCRRCTPTVCVNPRGGYDPSHRSVVCLHRMGSVSSREQRGVRWSQFGSILPCPMESKKEAPFVDGEAHRVQHLFRRDPSHPSSSVLGSFHRPKEGGNSGEFPCRIPRIGVHILKFGWLDPHPKLDEHRGTSSMCGERPGVLTAATNQRSDCIY